MPRRPADRARAPSNSARYSSSVCGVPPGRGGSRWCISSAKNHGSLRSGRWICGCCLSISYSAVVPLLGCPTTKKSGMRPRSGTARSPGVAGARPSPATPALAVASRNADPLSTGITAALLPPRRRASSPSGSRRSGAAAGPVVSKPDKRPSRITITRSQMSSVDMRCATTNSVNSCLSAVSDSWMSASDWGSSALVGSSRTSTCGRAASARARQTRCCWPPETASARGPTIVSYRLRPADHVVVDARQARGALHRLVVDVAEVADVLGHRGVDQARLLRHVGDQPVPVLGGAAAPRPRR